MRLIWVAGWQANAVEGRLWQDTSVRCLVAFDHRERPPFITRQDPLTGGQATFTSCQLLQQPTQALQRSYLRASRTSSSVSTKMRMLSSLLTRSMCRTRMPCSTACVSIDERMQRGWWPLCIASCDLTSKRMLPGQIQAVHVPCFG